MRAIQVGDVAPDFSLPGIRMRDGVMEHRDYRLSAHRGAPIVLAFYPLDASKVCTEQLCEYQREFDGFEALGTQVWAISLQDLESHEKFARQRGLSFPLLADQRGGAATAFGATMLGDLIIRRSIIIIDGEGIVRWVHRPVTGFFGYRHADELRAKILELFPEPAGDTFRIAPPVAADAVWPLAAAS